MSSPIIYVFFQLLGQSKAGEVSRNEASEMAWSRMADIGVKGGKSC